MFQLNSLLLTDDEEWQAWFSEHAKKHELHLTITHDLRKLKGQQNYNLYFLDVETVSLEQVGSKMGSKSVIVALTRTEDFANSRDWLVSGAKDIIVFPREAARVESLIQEVVSHYKMQKEAEMGFGSGDVRVFYSAKGGSGSTVLATMMSQSLSMHQKKVLLIDLNAQYGVTDSLFSIQPQRTYYDLLPVVNEMDLRHLKNIANDHEGTGVSIISSPSDPEKTEEITDELIAKMIRVGRMHYDHVIIDLPSAMNSITFTALNSATDLHYILTPDSLGLRAYKYANELFKRFSIGNGITQTLFLNKVHPKNEMTSSDIEKIIGKKINAKFTEDYFGMQPNINMGIGFFKSKKHKGDSKTARDMKRYIDSFVIKSKE